jgi:hypothetical protein
VRTDSNEAIVSMLSSLNDNVNKVRDDLVAALDKHEEKEMAEINSIHADIKELSMWRWRFVIALSVLLALGLVSFHNARVLDKIALLI